MRTLLTVLLTTASLWSASATAQQKPTLELVVDGADEDAARCGITQSGIESTAALTLRNLGIQVTAKTTSDPYLYVQVSALPVPSSGTSSGSSGGCAFHIGVSIEGALSLPQGMGRFKRKTGNADAVLCKRGGVSVASLGNAPTFFAQNLENRIKLCLGELNY
jgi:hypothetical protein